MNLLKNDLYYCEHLADTKEHFRLIQKFKIYKENGQGLKAYLMDQAVYDEIHNFSRTYLVRDNATHELVAYFSLKAGLFSLEHGLFVKQVQAFPGIELSNFAANDAYKDVHNDASGIGAIILSDFIFKIIREAQQEIGVCALYIFALPDHRLIEYYTKIGFRRLSARQERQLHRRIKPAYDRDCIFMFQGI